MTSHLELRLLPLAFLHWGCSLTRFLGSIGFFTVVAPVYLLCLVSRVSIQIIIELLWSRLVEILLTFSSSWGWMEGAMKGENADLRSRFVNVDIGDSPRYSVRLTLFGNGSLNGLTHPSVAQRRGLIWVSAVIDPVSFDPFVGSCSPKFVPVSELVFAKSRWNEFEDSTNLSKREFGPDPW